MFRKRQKDTQNKLPILGLVNGVYAICSRNLWMVVRAGVFPFVLTLIISLWQTPPHWGDLGFHAMRFVEWVLLLGLWTFYSYQLQRFVLKGPKEGGTSFLPKLTKSELKFAIASGVIFLPFTVFAVYYTQPLFFHQPDLVIMGSMVAMDGISELLYASLIAGWIIHIFAFVLPMIANGDERSLIGLFKKSFEAMRHNFSRLFGASLVVVLPIWIFVALLRLVLHMPFFTQYALGSDTSALVWNFAFHFLEAFKVFVAGGLMAMIWALAYARHRNKNALDFIDEN